MDISSIFTKSVHSGIGGAGAMMVSVTSLMWMRTVMNFQYRHGGTLKETFRLLYHQGGIPRFYRGYSIAILQGPLSRFGDTFSNTLVLQSLERHHEVPLVLKTAVASVSAGLFRILLMPVDTLKTTLQVEGKTGWTHLKTKREVFGPKIYFNGALALSSATMVGHYPWFLTFNTLDASLPRFPNDPWKRHSRNAFIGFTASVVSDTLSNSLRIIKTTKQTHQDHISYQAAVREILDKDGVKGLFGRGLGIRLLTNGIQGLLFTVVYKSLMGKN